MLINRRGHRIARLIGLSSVTLMIAACEPSHQQATNTASPQSVRVAVVGGMTHTGLWQALSERFSGETGQALEIVTGPKYVLDDVVRQGGIDLVTMHSSDTIVNLAADGYIENLQPWLRNDLVIVGPPTDPAGIRGLTDAGEAVRRIRESNSHFLVHASLGAQGVLKDVMHRAGIELTREQTTILLVDRHREVLKFAAEMNAYTLVGRIPFLSGRMENRGLVVMVQGDPALRRPYLVGVVPKERSTPLRHAAAMQLQRFLTSKATQDFITTFGAGHLDQHPIFFPAAPSRANTPEVTI